MLLVLHSMYVPTAHPGNYVGGEAERRCSTKESVASKPFLGNILAGTPREHKRVVDGTDEDVALDRRSVLEISSTYHIYDIN